MKRYVVAVKIRGQIVRTVVDAENPVHAELLAQYRFGINSLVGRPRLVAEGEVSYPLLDDIVAALENLQPIKPTKPIAPIKPAATPEQSRINMLKQNKQRADTALKSERDRQRVQRAQKTLFRAVR